MLHTENIEIEIKDKTLTVWLNKPEIRNALNLKTIEELCKVFKWIKKQNDILVVLIRGKGNSFCSGADINWMLNSGKADYKTAFNDSRKLAECFNHIYLSDKIIISLFHGDVTGGGLGFAGAADFTLAAQDTRFRLPELKLGLVPATIMPYLLTRISVSDFRFHVFTGEIFSAEKAYETGLIDFVCKDTEEMEMKASELIGSIIASSSKALAGSKKLLRTFNKSLINRENINKTVKTLTMSKMSDDARKRMTDFLLIKSGKVTITNR